MSPEENRDRTRTQGGSSVKAGYEATSRGSGVNPNNPTQDGQRLPVLKSFIEQERDWANHYLNLSNNERILTEHPMLCSWVQIPKNAEAAKGELRELSFWERLSNINLKDEAIELGEGALEFLAETRVTGDVIEFGKGALGSGTKKLGTITEGLGQVIYAPPGPNDAPCEGGWLNFLYSQVSPLLKVGSSAGVLSNGYDHLLAVIQSNVGYSSTPFTTDIRLAGSPNTTFIGRIEFTRVPSAFDWEYTGQISATGSSGSEQGCYLQGGVSLGAELDRVQITSTAGTATMGGSAVWADWETVI